MSSERVVRLGVDFGTSFSKLVFRDYGAPGGEKAYVLLKDGKFRVPSAVGVRDETFIFGVDPSRRRTEGGTVWHESLKMRVAGEGKHDLKHYFHGNALPLPAGFSAIDVTVLSVWYLISKGKKALKELFAGDRGTLVLGFTLGVPMSFFDDPDLRETFLRIARTAWEMSNTPAEDSVSFEDAKHLLQNAQALLATRDEISADSIKDWIRPEAEAALWWPFVSPSTSVDCPYAQLDVGAGTTNISIFRITPQRTEFGWGKGSLSFFGAASPPVGMDLIDSAIAEEKGDSDLLKWRGREDEVLYGKKGEQLISAEIKQLSNAHQNLLYKAFSTVLKAPSERLAWKSHRLFFLGGGSLNDCITKGLRVSPLDDGQLLTSCDLDVPPDIRLMDGASVHVSMFPHLAVAYGLSVLSADLPDVETPSQVPPMASPASRPPNYLVIEMDDWRY